MVRAIALCLFFMLAVCRTLAASAEPVRPLDLDAFGAPVFTNFSSRDGLPEAVTVDVRTDRDGFVWAATPVGVYRYDGHRWVPCSDPSMTHPVDSLWVDSGGVLWAAFRNHGLAHFDGHGWIVEDLSTGLPSQQVRRFSETVDAAGQATLWAATWDRGLMLRTERGWIADPGNASLPPGPILSLAQTQAIGGSVRQWAGTGTEGLWYRELGTRDWTRYSIGGVDTTQVEFLRAVGNGPDEALWISVFGEGLVRLDAGGIRRWTADDGSLPTNDLYDIVATGSADGSNDIWISSRSGLVRIHRDQVQVFDRRHGLPSNAIRALNAWHSPGDETVVWLATEVDISRTVLGTSPWTTASLLGSTSTGVFTTLVEPDGRGGERLWVGGSKDGLAIYEAGEWRRYGAVDGSLPNESVGMIRRTEGPDGAVHRWLGLWGGHLLRIEPGPRFEPITSPWPETNGEAVLDVLERVVDGQPELWVGTRQSGVWRLRQNRWQHFEADGIAGQWRIVRLIATRDAEGRDWIWASTNQGLARYDGERWTLLGRSVGLPDINLLGLTLLDDAQGHPVLWAGSVSAGIIRIDIRDPRQPRVRANDLPAAPDAISYGVQRDSAGRLYNCTNNGVQQLLPKPGGFSSRVFTRSDGMLHDECNTSAQFVDAHDRFWTGTLGGLTVYDPQREPRGSVAKPLRLTGVRVDRDWVAMDAVSMPADAQALQVEFALLSWHRENESRFRSQLIGFEDEPGPWTAQRVRSFTNLPPGDYRLRIEAQDYAGTPSTPIELAISVAPSWWERWSARVAGIAALLGLGYALSLLRTRRLRQRQALLEARVAERTAELHAANAQLVELSYLDALTGLANRRRLIDFLDAAIAPHQSHDRPMALILLDVDHFKAYNDRWGHVAGDAALRSVADVLRSGVVHGQLAARYGGEEFAVLVPGARLREAAEHAERLRVAVASAAPLDGSVAAATRITVSAGIAVATLRQPDDVDTLLRAADAALYRAKKDGRDRVHSGETAEPAHPAPLDL